MKLKYKMTKEQLIDFREWLLKLDPNTVCRLFNGNNGVSLPCERYGGSIVKISDSILGFSPRDMEGRLAVQPSLRIWILMLTSESSSYKLMSTFENEWNKFVKEYIEVPIASF